MSMSLQTSYSDLNAIGQVGQLRNQPNIKESAKNADSVSIPFGTVVAFKPSPTSDLDVYIPAASTDKLRGVAFRADSYSRTVDDQGNFTGDLDATGLRVGRIFGILRKGTVLVFCHTGCAPSDRLFVCYAAGGSTYTVKGQLGNVAETSHTLDASGQGEWKSTAAADGLAWLECDFVNK